jgi:hypothetical protein
VFENWLEHSTAINASDNPERSVRLSFSIRPNSLSVRMAIFIGTDVATQCHLKSGDRIFFLVNPKNKREFVVKKGSQDKGYKLTASRKRGDSGNFLHTICASWLNEGDLYSNDYKSNIGKHEIKEGFLFVNFEKNKTAEGEIMNNSNFKKE